MSSNIEVQIDNEPSNQKKKSKLIVVLIVVLLVISIVCSYLAIMLFTYDKVYRGISLNGYDISGYSTIQIEDYIINTFIPQIENREVSIMVNGVTETYKYPDITDKIDPLLLTNQIYSLGRNENPFARTSKVLAAFFSGFDYIYTPSIDKEKANTIIESLYKKHCQPAIHPQAEINDNQIIISSGQHGYEFNKEELLNLISEEINDINSDGVIEISIKRTNSAAIDPEKIYDSKIAMLNKEYKNAQYTLIDNQIEIIPHVVGRVVTIDDISSSVSKLMSLSDNQEKIATITVPIKTTLPDKTTELLKESLFKDILYTYQTSFSTETQNNYNRSINIKLSTESINGLILLPGDEFSFNKVVGPRTAERGYQTANVYYAGKVIQGIGGGLCQTSTTLYNAVLYSNLQITERLNHQFTVGYVPFGQDATVSYGTVDFKFKNNTDFPIKIEGQVKNNKVIYKVYGTKSQDDVKVSIINKTIDTYEIGTEYEVDPTLAPGSEIIVENGSKGYKIDTYKQVTVNGRVISYEKLYTSVYNPHNKLIKHNPLLAPTPTPTDIPAPTPTITPEASPTDIPTPTITPEPMPTDIPAPTPTLTPEPSPTDVPTPSSTPEPSPTPATESSEMTHTPYV